MYPLRFEPQFQRYLWGGHRLSTMLGKACGPDRAAESWEVVDHADAQSVVQFGPLAQRTLHSLVEEYQGAFVGDAVWQEINSPQRPDSLRGRFPWLLKFLDAQTPLSVQVHPDDSMGRTLDPPDLGKTEAWYVLHADQGAKLYVGLREGVDRSQFQTAIEAGTTDQLLHCVEPQAGECYLVEAGTLHAIGGGLVIAEIQQASNTTFRVFDWNRVDAEGNSRPLHIDAALRATDFSRGPVSPWPAEATEQPGRTRVVACSRFVMDRWQLSATATLGGDGQCRIVSVIEGEVSLSGDPAECPLTLGQTAPLPACLPEVTLTPGPSGCRLLEIRAS